MKFLGILTALLNAIPALLKAWREWRTTKKVVEEQAAKDARNDKAVDDALKSQPNPPAPPTGP